MKKVSEKFLFVAGNGYYYINNYFNNNTIENQYYI